MQADLFSVGHAAAERSAARADRAEPDWTESAVTAVRKYADTLRIIHGRPESFLAEKARAHAEMHGLSEPPDSRAWGHVMQLCKRRKILKPVGYAPAESSNGSPKVLWREV